MFARSSLCLYVCLIFLHVLVPPELNIPLNVAGFPLASISYCNLLPTYSFYYPEKYLFFLPKNALNKTQFYG